MSSQFGIKSRLWLSFSVTHFNGHPSEISNLLNQKPFRVLVKGDPYASGKKTQGFSLWSLKVESPRHDLDKQMTILLKKIQKLPLVRKRVGKFYAGITAVLEIVGEDTRPTLCLSPIQLVQMGELGVTFSVDYYFFEKPLTKGKRKKKDL